MVASPRSRIVETFKQFDGQEGGGVTPQELVSIVKSLDPYWTEERVAHVCSAAGVSLEGALDLEGLVAWLFHESSCAAKGPRAREGEAVLREYFLSEAYAAGLPLETDGTGYAFSKTGEGVPVYRHEASGIEVLREALELAPTVGGSGEMLVLFAYTDGPTLAAIAGEILLTTEAWKSLQGQGAEDGVLCASSAEPAALAALAAGGNVHCCVPLLVPAGMATEGSGAAPSAPDAWTVRSRSSSAAVRAAASNREARRRRLLQHREAQLGEGHQGTRTAMNDLVFLLERRGKLSEAVALCRRAVKAAETHLGREDPGTLSELNNLAYLVERSGDAKEAEALARRALAGREAALGAEHPDTLTSAYNLAELLESQGELDEAEELYQRELAWCRSTYGARAQQTRASTRNLNRFWAEHGRGVHAKSADPRRFTTHG